ncbi:MAG: hypothetical protein MUO62_00745 [Anaerolineales bacterium]|nr:hypothetical protein [Anaerolineales bacterium]
MSVKLLMTWDIIPGREQDYFEFVVREFIPEIQHLGLEPSDAWVTVYGRQPQILTSAKIHNQESLNAILDSAEWDKLLSRLNEYVENLAFKTVRTRPGFQM